MIDSGNALAHAGQRAGDSAGRIVACRTLANACTPRAIPVHLLLACQARWHRLRGRHQRVISVQLSDSLYTVRSQTVSAPGACRTALDGLRQRMQLLRGVYSRLKHHRCLCVRTGNREGTRAPHAALHWSRVITAKSLGALCRRDPERERLKTHKLCALARLQRR